MTDNEIIKALPKMLYGGHTCRNCKYGNGKGDDRCGLKGCKIARNAIDLIIRQQEEIERLRKEVNLVSIQFQDLQERYEEAQIEIEQWKEEANRYQRLWCMAIEDIDDIETAE